MPIYPRLKHEKETVSVEHRKAEVELVNARVTKTKKEIEELKAQLQQLISDGIKKTNFTETKQNIVALSDEYKNGTYNEETPVSNKSESVVANAANANKARTFKDSIADIIGNTNEVHHSVPTRHSTSPQRSKTDLEDDVPRKVRHYDQESARKYMEKQKQKRKQLMNHQKHENEDLQQMKKQRLEELRRKSQELLSKNVKRRSVQKEDKNSINQESAKNLSSSVTVHKDTMQKSKSENVLSSQNKSFKLSHPELKNITFRSPNTDYLSAIAILNETKRELEREKAAIKIQSAFRCYCQRKKFLLSEIQKQEKEVQTQENIPVWLQQPTAMPYPYNFIDAVKKKLNLAVQQINTYNIEPVINTVVSEPSAQKSFSHDKFQNLEESRQPKLKVSSSFLPHKCLTLDTKTVEPLGLTAKALTLDLQNIKFKPSITTNQQNVDLQRVKFQPSQQQNSDSDTSKNIPDLSSENSVKHSIKRRHSSDTDDKKFQINVEKIKKMKLHQPKRINFDTVNDSNSPEEVFSQNNLNSDFLHLNHNYVSSGKESIISSNKCDYFTNHSTNKSLQKNKNDSSKLNSLKSSLKNCSSTEILTEVNSKESLVAKSKSNTREESISPVKSRHSDVTKSRTASGIENSKSNTLEESMSSIKNRHSDVTKSGTTSVIEKSKSNTRDESVSSVKSQHSDVTKSRNSNERLKAKSDTVVSKDAEYSSNFISVTSNSSLPSLKYPSASLRSSHSSLNKLKDNEDENTDRSVTNIVLKDGEKTKTQIKTSEIHLKFEAELHLLNDFNDSLRQVMAVEKSLLELRDKKSTTNESNIVAPMLFTRDTQTSIVTKSSTDPKVTNNNTDLNPTINYSRGSEVLDLTENFATENTDMTESSLIVSGMELSQLQDNSLSLSLDRSNLNVSVRGDISDRSMMKDIPLEMFDQLIQDEDIRIENLKTILKIREKSLVDRTKGELAWLEVQKKQLKDSGQLQQISAIKKKQRGLLIKLEHERHEMQRLKQMQKIASKKRKSVLKEKRNMIKIQLSTNNVITKIKRNAKEEKRPTGPLKVYNIKSHSESVRSETSVSRRSSITEEIVSVVSQSKSIVSHIKEESVFGENQKITKNQLTSLLLNSQIEAEHIRRSLLMREEALQKRRQAAEELLQWHQRLIEEEKKIAELESAANAIVNQTQSTVVIPISTNLDNQNQNGKHKFKGSQLNILWSNMTGREEKKFNDKLTYSMSKASLEQFCQDAKKAIMSHKLKSLNKKSENRANLYGESVKSSETVKHKNDSIVNIKADSDYTLEFDSSYSIADDLQSNKSILLTNELNEEISDETVSEETVKSSVSEKLSNPQSVTEQISNNKSELSSDDSQLLQKKYSEYQTEVDSNENETTETTSNQIASKTGLGAENSREETDNGSNSELSVEEEESEISSEYPVKIQSKSDEISYGVNESSIISNIENILNTESEFPSNKKSSKSVESPSSVANETTSTKVQTNSLEDQTGIDISKQEENTLITEKLSEYDSKSKEPEDYIRIDSIKENSIIISARSIKSLEVPQHSDSDDAHSSTTIVSSNVIDNKKSSTTLSTFQSVIKSNDEKSSKIEKISSRDDESESVQYNMASEDEIKSTLSKTNEKISSSINNEISETTSEQNTTLHSIKEISSNIMLDNFSSKSEIGDEINQINQNENSQIISDYDSESDSKNKSSAKQQVSILHSETKSDSKSSVFDVLSKSEISDKINQANQNENSPIISDYDSESDSKNKSSAKQQVSILHSETKSDSKSSVLDVLSKSEVGDEINQANQNENSPIISDYDSESDSKNKSSAKQQVSILHSKTKSDSKSSVLDVLSKSEIGDEINQANQNENSPIISDYDSEFDFKNESSEKQTVSTSHSEVKIDSKSSAPEDHFDQTLKVISINENLEEREYENSVDEIKSESNFKTDEDIKGVVSKELNKSNSKSQLNESVSVEAETSAHVSEIETNEGSRRESFESSNGNIKSTSEILQESLNRDELPSDNNVDTEHGSKQESSELNIENLQNSSEIEHDDVSNNKKVESDSSIEESVQKLGGSEKNSVLELSLKDEIKSKISTKNQNETLFVAHDDEESSRKVVVDLNIDKLISHNEIERKGDDEIELHTPEEQVSPNDSRNSSLHDIESIEKSYSEKFDNDDDVSEKNQEITEINGSTDKEERLNLQFEIENEESVTTSSVISKVDSPLLLSYGYIERKNENLEEDTLDSITNEDDFDAKESVSVETNLDQTKKSKLLEDDAEGEDKITIENVCSKNVQVELEPIDVKKRVSEILADANIVSPRGDRSPKLQNLYVTAYDIISPDHSPESDSPVEETKLSFSPLPRVYGSDEVEELLKKQLAIEQEIKEIQQQQKEHLPYVYVREIPNKPPPPYKPPLISHVPDSQSIIPSTDNQMSAITALSADVLHEAYFNRNLENVKLSDNLKSLLCNKHKIESSCVTFVFDLCKEAAVEHYKQFTSNEGPSWMHLSKKSKLAVDNLLSKSSLEKSLNKRIDQWLGHEVVKSIENNKHKWSSKKRDHVDDLLVIECQAEESEWTNYDRDELVVKDELTKNIMDMLIDETAQLINDILIKKKKSLR